MSNAAIDVNSKQTITGRLNTDGVTVTRIKANPSTGALKVSDGTIGTAVADEWAATDDNGRITLMAVSSSNSKVLIALQVNSSGQLLIDSH